MAGASPGGGAPSFGGGGGAPSPACAGGGGGAGRSPGAPAPPGACGSPVTTTSVTTFVSAPTGTPERRSARPAAAAKARAQTGSNVDLIAKSFPMRAEIPTEGDRPAWRRLPHPTRVAASMPECRCEPAWAMAGRTPSRWQEPVRTGTPAYSRVLTFERGRPAHRTPRRLRPAHSRVLTFERGRPAHRTPRRLRPALRAYTSRSGPCWKPLSIRYVLCRDSSDGGSRGNPPLHHFTTPSLHHSTTPSLHHSITPLLRPSGQRDSTARRRRRCFPCRTGWPAPTQPVPPRCRTAPRRSAARAAAG